MKKIIVAAALLLFISTFTASAQTPADQLQQGLKLKADSKFPEAFAVFQPLLKSDSTNVDYLTNMSFLYAKLGWRQKTEDEKQAYYGKSEYLALKAIKQNNNSADAHYVYAFSLGRINEFASSKQKIANAKLIKTECDKALSINPNMAGVYHILGRWHRTIAGFGAFEKFMINSFFGGVPQGGTYDDAIKNFAKAIQLEPAYILHQYELAQTYYERDAKGDVIYAKVWTEKALKCPINSIDDQETKKRCLELLAKVQ
ncbi:MAG: hypothetical protein ABI723_15345 [Bacteroidia bacterium]